LDGISCLLRCLRKQTSFDLLMVAIARMVIEPVFELVISSKQEFERFGHDVGWGCVDKLSAILKLQFDSSSRRT